MNKRKRIIIVGLVYGVIVTLFFVWAYYVLVDIAGVDQIITPIQDVDEEQRHDRPYMYIEPISSSNNISVEDLFTPISFNNDNITVSFPEGETYLYHIGLGPENLNGRLHVYRSNGSELWTIISEGSWSDSTGRQGGSIRGMIEENGNLTLRFSGSGNVLFLSSHYTELFEDSEDHSGTVQGGKTAFYVPRGLIHDLPDDRRVIARIESGKDTHFGVRYYDEEMHLLKEIEGTGTVETEIPIGYSDSTSTVVETDGNVTFQFSQSEPIMGELAPLGWFLLISYMLVVGFGFALIMYVTLSLEEVPRIVDQGSQQQ